MTKVSGIYGWPGDRNLHEVHFYDGRGRKRPHDFVTTVDQDGVRTEVTLSEGESAVIERIPVRLAVETLNVHVFDYDAGRLTMTTSLSPGNVQEISFTAHGTEGTILESDRNGLWTLAE